MILTILVVYIFLNKVVLKHVSTWSWKWIFLILAGYDSWLALVQAGNLQTS